MLLLSNLRYIKKHSLAESAKSGRAEGTIIKFAHISPTMGGADLL